MRRNLPAAAAIIALWAAVAAVGVRGRDVIVEHKSDSGSQLVSVPAVAGVALFAAVATIVIALVGIRPGR